MKDLIIFDLEGTLVDVAGKLCKQVFISEDLLRNISSKYEIGIVTGATREELQYVLSTTFLGLYFQEKNTITATEVFEEKKTGKSFQKLIQKIKPRRSVILGDSEGDRLGSQVLNISFVRVDPRLLSLDILQMDEYVRKAIENKFD